MKTTNNNKKEVKMKPKAVIVDIDGTLFKEVPNWTKETETQWIQETQFMPSMEVGIGLTRAFKESGFKLVFLTARGESCVEVTWSKFREEGIDTIVDEMIHRPLTMESVASDKYKRTMMEDIMSRYKVMFAMDDSDKNLAMFASLGIKTIDAKKWW